MTLPPRSQEDLDCWKKLENCLSAPYLLKEQMDFDHTCTSRLLGHVKEWLYFGDLDPIFKVTWWLRWLENGMSASYLLNEWMGFYQTSTSILLRHGKELMRFWWPWPHFQGHRRAQIVGKWLVCTLSHEALMDFDQTCITCITILLWHAKVRIRFGDLDPIFKVRQGLRLLENGFSAPYLMKEWMDFD